MMYQLYIRYGQTTADAVMTVGVEPQISFVLCESTIEKFKSDIANGAELQDAEGKVMTKEQVQTFLGGLK